MHAQHWALRGVACEFKTCCLNKWDPHPVNIACIGSVGRNYTTLAESVRGPMVVEHNNTLAVQFVVDSQRYPETAQIISNFVARKMEEVKVSQNKFDPVEIRQSGVHAGQGQTGAADHIHAAL